MEIITDGSQAASTTSAGTLEGCFHQVLILILAYLIILAHKEKQKLFSLSLLDQKKKDF